MLRLFASKNRPSRQRSFRFALILEWFWFLIFEFLFSISLNHVGGQCDYQEDAFCARPFSSQSSERLLILLVSAGSEIVWSCYQYGREGASLTMLVSTRSSHWRIVRRWLLGEFSGGSKVTFKREKTFSNRIQANLCQDRRSLGEKRNAKVWCPLNSEAISSRLSL